MMVVPRSEKNFVSGSAAVGVNAFAFLGLLLARDPASLHAIQSARVDGLDESGPMSVLQAVTFEA